MFFPFKYQSLFDIVCRKFTFNCFPFSVKRYFCKALLGLSRIVISMKPIFNAGFKKFILRSFLSEISNIFCISSRFMSLSMIEISFSTWG